MNISVKDMIISFAAGLVIFSLLMVFVCVGIFNSEIEVAASDIPHSVENEKIDLHSVVIFTVPSLDSTNLDFAVLAMLDEKGKTLYFTAVYGDYLMNYRNSLSYVSGVYRKLGNSMLPELVKAFSGVTADKVVAFQNVINFAEFKTELENYFLTAPDKFVEVFDSELSYSEINIKDLPLAISEQKTENTHERIEVIDVESSVEIFKSIIG